MSDKSFFGEFNEMNSNPHRGGRGASQVDVEGSPSKGRQSVAEPTGSSSSSPGAIATTLIVCSLVMFHHVQATQAATTDPAGVSAGGGANEYDAMLPHDSSVLIGDTEPLVRQDDSLAFEHPQQHGYDLDTWGANAVVIDRGGHATWASGQAFDPQLSGHSNSCLADGCDAYGACYDEQECRTDCKEGCCGPRWSVAADALMLWQGNIQSLPLFTDSSGVTVLDADQLVPPMSAGPRISLVRHIGCEHAIEGNYLNVGTFPDQKVLPAEGGPYSMVNLADLVFDDIKDVQVTGSGRFQSAELNWRRSSGGAITWLAGFRWVEWTQQTVALYNFTNPNPFGDGGIGSQVGNNLYGGQGGADVKLWDAGGRIKVNGVGKAGVFYNRAAYQRTAAGFTFSDGTPFPLGVVAATADQTSFFGEVGANAAVWLTPWLAWRAGYSLFWLSGVAVPAEQFPLANFGSGTATINTSGSVLLHGVTTGIEARW